MVSMCRGAKFGLIKPCHDHRYLRKLVVPDPTSACSQRFECFGAFGGSVFNSVDKLERLWVLWKALEHVEFADAPIILSAKHAWGIVNKYLLSSYFC